MDVLHSVAETKRVPTGLDSEHLFSRSSISLEKLISRLTNLRNWDWKSAASVSLISLDILAYAPTNRPRIKMMTEAGVIGKIGVNSHGISVMLNALKVSFPLPPHNYHR